MPNLYATPIEIKAANPEAYSSDQTAHDGLIYRVSERVSRLIDAYTSRHFYPYLATRYFEGSGDSDQWFDDIVSVTTLAVGTGGYDSDGAVLDSDFAATDYILHSGRTSRPIGSYNRAVMAYNGLRPVFPMGQDQVQITGTFAYHGDRASAWADSLDAVGDSPLTSDATSITATDADGAGLWGVAPRFQAGQILRIESEYLELTAVNDSTNVLTVVRGRNGTTAASHVQTTQIDVWIPDPLVNEVCVMECTRLLQRGLEGFGDARANPELGQIIRTASLDPQAQAMLEPLRKFVIAG